MYIILYLVSNSPTIGLAITRATKYIVKTNDILFPAWRSSLIVGMAKEIIEVSIAAINIVKIRATTTPIDFNLILDTSLSFKILPIYIINVCN